MFVKEYIRHYIRNVSQEIYGHEGLRGGNAPLSLQRRGHALYRTSFQHINKCRKNVFANISFTWNCLEIQLPHRTQRHPAHQPLANSCKVTHTHKEGFSASGGISVYNLAMNFFPRRPYWIETLNNISGKIKKKTLILHGSVSKWDMNSLGSVKML